MQILNSPDSITRRMSQTWWLDSRNISGGMSLSGREQVIVSPSPVWRATITYVSRGNDRSKQFRAWVTRFRGRARAMRLTPERCLSASLYDRLGIVRPPEAEAGIPHSDDAFFDDDVGYEWPTPQFTLLNDLDAFDNELMLHTNGHAPGLIVGDWFGLGGNLYLIVGIYDIIAETGGHRMTIAFEPNLRKPATAGSLITMRPTVVMRLTSDDQGTFEKGLNKVITPSLELIELPELT